MSPVTTVLVALAVFKCIACVALRYRLSWQVIRTRNKAIPVFYKTLIVFLAIILCTIYNFAFTTGNMEDLLRLEAQICFPLSALSREITGLYRPLLDGLGLTYPQYLVLLVLWEQKEQTVNQLGEKLRLDSGTLTPLLKRMEQKGIVTRTRSAQDERVVQIALTSSGKALKQKARRIPEQLLASINASMEELQQLKNLIQKILTK